MSSKPPIPMLNPVEIDPNAPKPKRQPDGAAKRLQHWRLTAWFTLLQVLGAAHLASAQHTVEFTQNWSNNQCSPSGPTFGNPLDIVDSFTVSDLYYQYYNCSGLAFYVVAPSETGTVSFFVNGSNYGTMGGGCNALGGDVNMGSGCGMTVNNASAYELTSGGWTVRMSHSYPAYPMTVGMTLRIHGDYDSDNDGLRDSWEIDCDGNGTPDHVQISQDPSSDTDGNGVLDSCELTSPYWVWSEVSQRFYASLAPGSWAQASAIAPSYGGHLVTVRSEEELEWLQTRFGGEPFWIGLSDVVVEDEFRWENGEPFLFENWAPGEPSTVNPGLDLVAMNPGLPVNAGTWETWGSSFNFRAIIELGGPTDCNANGIPDALDIAGDPSLDCDLDAVLDSCQIAAGAALDCNGNSLIDSCEIITDPALDLDLNGILDTCEISGPYWFRSPITQRLLTVLPPSLFGSARAQATILGGTLATVRSTEENDWLQGVLPGSPFWIGYNDATVEGVFIWHSLETPGYENWAPGAPGSFTADQDYVAFRPIDGTWDTWFLNSLYRAVVESNAIDCDGDLVLDDVQIQNDPSLDCDSNGQIDSCEILADSSLDCDGDGTLDLCSVQDPIFDCDGNGLVDDCEITADSDLDCNGNLILDSCETLDATEDCDGNGFVDSCEFTNNPSLDCNNNLWLDSCEILDPIQDCDDNDLVDECEITANPSLDCNANGILDVCEVQDPALDMNGDGLLDSCVPPTYCTGAPNSAGAGASIMAFGSPELALNNLTLSATGLPSLQWSYFLMSRNQTSVPNFGGSQGVLCLGAPIERFNMPGTGQINQTSAAGERSYTLDFSLLPQGIVFQPGETWNFQLWFRDVNPSLTSNTTNGVTVMFR